MDASEVEDRDVQAMELDSGGDNAQPAKAQRTGRQKQALLQESASEGEADGYKPPQPSARSFYADPAQASAPLWSRCQPLLPQSPAAVHNCAGCAHMGGAHVRAAAGSHPVQQLRRQLC